MPQDQLIPQFEFGQQLSGAQAQYLVDTLGEARALYEIQRNRNTVPNGWVPDPKRMMEMERLDLERRRTAATESKAYDLPKPKQGYQWTPEGDRQVPIPGGPVWQKLKNEHAEDVNTYKGTDLLAANAISKVNRLLNTKNKEGFESLFGGYYATLVGQHMPFWNTQDLKNDLEALKSNVMSVGLDLARRGGSVGTITEREWPILGSMIERLSTMTSESEARRMLGRIKAHMQRMRRDAKKKYIDTWGESEWKQDLKETQDYGKVPKYTSAEEAEAAFARGEISDGEAIEVGGRPYIYEAPR